MYLAARTMKTKLTQLEIEALLDRLELDGAENIAEALTDCADGDEPHVPDSPSEVMERARRIARAVKATQCWPDTLNHLDREILVECVDGSTFQCRDTPAESARAIQVLERLAKKMIAAGIASRIYVPTV